MVYGVRSFIFTDRERRLLERWLEKGEEDVDAPRVFHWIRRNTLPLARDMELMLRVVERLRLEGRWSGRLTSRSMLGSKLRLAESTLIRLRRRGHTSGA